MGQVTFTEYFHLLLTGREPTEDQRFFLDLLLVAIAEHGMMPTNVAARMTLAADPGSLQGALAAGMLGAGPVVLGTSEECARLLVAGGAEGRGAAAGGPGPRRPGGRGARLRAPRPPSGRSQGRAHPRARRRARRERCIRGVRTLPPRRCRRGLGQTAPDERRPPDRGRAARPRVLGRDREDGSSPRAH